MRAGDRKREREREGVTMGDTHKKVSGYWKKKLKKNVLYCFQYLCTIQLTLESYTETVHTYVSS